MAKKSRIPGDPKYFLILGLGLLITINLVYMIVPVFASAQATFTNTLPKDSVEFNMSKNGTTQTQLGLGQMNTIYLLGFSISVIMMILAVASWIGF